MYTDQAVNQLYKTTVSYTHLDVYKRQLLTHAEGTKSSQKFREQLEDLMSSPKGNSPFNNSEPLGSQ